MTKCPKCKFYSICGGRLNETVENCVRFKSIEPTNEEWLRQCNTEQLAEWIAHQTMIALLENQNNHSLRMTYPAYWVDWLKQPHTNE